MSLFGEEERRTVESALEQSWKENGGINNTVYEKMKEFGLTQREVIMLHQYMWYGYRKNLEVQVQVFFTNFVEKKTFFN